jgi:hypothetical protein
LLQGLPKKIQLHLLLPDLPLQLGNAAARPSDVVLLWRRRPSQARRLSLPRSTTQSQTIRTARPKVVSPLVEILTQNPKLARQSADVLPR